MECFDDRAGNAASFGHVVAVPGGPFPDGLVLVTVRPAGRGGRAPRRDAACAVTAETRCGREVGVEGLAELAGVLLRKVDGVVHAVESEFDSTVGFASVNVIGQQGDDLFCHGEVAPESAVSGTGE